MSDEDKIADRIRKLFALAESPNEHEAAAAAERAQELLLKHGLSEADVMARTTDGGTVAAECSTCMAPTLPWVRALAAAVAEGCGGHAIFNRSTSEHTFYGPAGTTRGMVELFLYLRESLDQAATVASVADCPEWEHPVSYRTSWLWGALQRLYERLMARREAMATESTPGALVLVSDAARRKMQEDNPNLRKDTHRPDINSLAGAMDGEAAGANIPLGDPEVRGRRGELAA